MIKLKFPSKFILIGILSLLIGSAFASPLLVSELDLDEIKLFPETPKGPKAEIISEVLFANFSIKSNSEKESLSDLSYFVVLNVTNNSNEAVNVIGVQFDAEISNYSYTFDNNMEGTSEIGHGWDAEGAWVDDEYYNLTWVPNKRGEIGVDGFFGEFESESEGYWMEGVQIFEKYTNYDLVFTKINMNGTWVDVTGRIEYPPLVGWPPTKIPDGTIFSEIKFLGGGEFPRDPDNRVSGLQVPTSVPNDFNEHWGPHQSRLILLTMTRTIPSKYYEPSKLELLKTTKTSFITSVTGYFNNTTIRSQSTTENTAYVQLETTNYGHLYTVLPDNQKFVLDSFGVEVFLESRN